MRILHGNLDGIWTTALWVGGTLGRRHWVGHLDGQLLGHMDGQLDGIRGRQL